ncbi:MAG: peptidyl-prolyl cis-trans isomerase [Deltaproteobacteria bacterium]|nr:peptidyl-prolyl cis-trans isomerase [Deltaproteobacteria bacterium]
MTPDQGRAIMSALQGLYIISDEAERLGFSVGEKELARAIYPAQFFQEKKTEDGEEEAGKEFNWEDYNAWVSYWLHASQSQYEDYTRRVLLAQKMMVFFSGLVQVTDGDAEAAALAKQHQVNLEVAEFPAATFKDKVEVPADLAAFIEEKKDAIDEYYDAHPAEFHSARQVQVRVALASALPPGPPADPKNPPVPDFEKARVKADELMARLKGDQPLLPPPPPPPPPEPPAEGGEAAAPAAGAPAPAAPPEEPADPGERFKALAKHWSDDPETRDRSGLVTGWKEIEGFAAAPWGPEVSAALATAPSATVLGPVKGEAGFWILRVEDVREARDLELEAARSEIAATLYRDEHAMSVAKARAEAFLAAAGAADGQTLEQLLEADAWKDLGVTARKTGLFPATTGRSSIPTVGPDAELFEDAFRMADAAPLASRLYGSDEARRYLVVRLVERQRPAEGKAPEAEDLETARETLGIEREVASFQAWYESLLQRARDEEDIQYTEDYETYLQFLKTAQETREAQEARQAARKARAR